MLRHIRRLQNCKYFGEVFLTYKSLQLTRSISQVNAYSKLQPTKLLNFKNKYSTSIRLCSNIINSEQSTIKQETADDDAKEINFERITGGDPVLDRKLKILLLEAEVSRQDGRKVPSIKSITEPQWKELLAKSSQSARRKYFAFLFANEKKKENKKLKKAEIRKTQLEKLNEDRGEEDDGNGHLKYGLGHNTIFIRIYDTTINQVANNKLIQAMQFGQKLVVDCGYDEHMNPRERQNTGKQLMLLFAENRAHADPFDLHYCNANFNNETMRTLSRHIPTFLDPEFPLHVHTDSYLDHFPKNKLVYLTPHCRDDLVEYDHDAVYIIGAMVDKTNNEPVSLAKAKREGLSMKRLPLDNYLQWGCGSGKNLTINQVASILLDVKMTGDWNYALRHVPRRKIIEPGVNILNNVAGNLRFDRNRSRRITSYREKFTKKNNEQDGNTLKHSKGREKLIKNIFKNE